MGGNPCAAAAGADKGEKGDDSQRLGPLVDWCEVAIDVGTSGDDESTSRTQTDYRYIIFVRILLSHIMTSLPLTSLTTALGVGTSGAVVACAWRGAPGALKMWPTGEGECFNLPRGTYYRYIYITHANPAHNLTPFPYHAVPLTVLGPLAQRSLTAVRPMSGN